MTLADGPIIVIRPLVTTIVACSIGALPVPSITRAPVKAMVPAAGVCAWTPDTATDVAATKKRKPTTLRVGRP
jgi:hypothetical protein